MTAPINLVNFGINPMPCDEPGSTGIVGYTPDGQPVSAAPGSGLASPTTASNWQRVIDTVNALKTEVIALGGLGGGGPMAALPVGAVMMWAVGAAIPAKWAQMDGIANTSGSGISMVGYTIVGRTGTPDNTVNGSNTYSIGSTGSGGTGATGSSTTGITVANHSTTAVASCLVNHDDHGHAYTDDLHEVVDAGVLDNTYDGNTTQNRHTTGVETVGGGAAAAGVLGHTGSSSSNDLHNVVTDPGHTHTGPSHTHTIPDITQAPASKRMVFIEKIVA